MAQYNDIYVRDSFTDTGSYPSVGNPWMSPDIIPLQQDTLTTQRAVDTYSGPALGKDIVSPGINNIYVRAKNLRSGDPETGSVSLYYSKASLLLRPSDWRGNAVLTPGGQLSAPFVGPSGDDALKPDEIALTSPAFLLQGLPPIAATDHYCLVAIVQTPNTAVQIPDSFTYNWEFADWVMNQPAVAWRNLSVVSSSIPHIVKNTEFANLDPTQEYFHFRFEGRGFPTGTTVRAQCTDQKCPIDQTMTLPAPDALGNQPTGFDQLVPSLFAGTLITDITPPQGQHFTPGAEMPISYLQYQRKGISVEAERVSALTEITRETAGTHAQFTESLIKLGQVTIALKGN